MFRISARDAHTWQDFAKNMGKLSLAGLFMGGTWFLSHAYAASPAEQEPIRAAAQIAIQGFYTSPGPSR